VERHGTWQAQRGITILEIAILLVVTAALVAAIAPALTSTLRDARIVRAITDMEAIRDAILLFTSDGFMRFTIDGSQDAGSQAAFLYSDGDIPAAGNSPDWRESTASDQHGFLEEHLVLNWFNGGASYPLAGSPAWRGAYINAPIDPDPWGNRYAVNVRYMGPDPHDVVVLCAGPDEAIDTPEEGNPLIGGHDDILVLVEG
jgi:type II secretory pathway pseudopilin PulG